MDARIEVRKVVSRPVKAGELKRMFEEGRASESIKYYELLLAENTRINERYGL